jgi:hypothetical protein
LSLCLASVGAGKTLSIAAFTPVWTHSIEKVDWQEDRRITPKGARTGAGPGQGFWRRHGAAAGEWRVCSDGRCETLSEILGHPVGVNTTTMSVCP